MKFYMLLFLSLFMGWQVSYAQEDDYRQYVYGTFKTTRVINSHSVETLKKGHLDFRVTHRFGDLIKDWNAQNTWNNFLGFEDAADILIGLEYGLTDQLMLSFSRTKGGGNLRQLLHGIAKYRPLTQTIDNQIPLSIAAVGTATFSTMPKLDFDPFNPTLASFETCEGCGAVLAHRMMYALELHLARKFSGAFSLDIAPILVWRNFVPNGESNALLSLNAATRIQLTKVVGILVDANLPLSGAYYNDTGNYTPAIGVGVEFETAGHVFQINLTNSRGIVTTDYVPTTVSNWANGEFRLGFTISRVFNLGAKNKKKL